MDLKETLMDIDFLDTKNYVVVDKVSPVLKLPKEIPYVARKIAGNIENPKVAAYAVSDWISKNYGSEDTTKIGKEKSRLIYMLKHGAGDCLPKTLLHVALTKSLGIDTRIAIVEIDEFNEEVKHTCSYLNYNGENSMFDPSYRDGDAKHRRIKVASRRKTNEILESDIFKSFYSAYKHFEDKRDFKKMVDIYDISREIFPELGNVYAMGSEMIGKKVDYYNSKNDMENAKKAIELGAKELQKAISMDVGEEFNVIEFTYE